MQPYNFSTHALEDLQAYGLAPAGVFPKDVVALVDTHRRLLSAAHKGSSSQ